MLIQGGRLLAVTISISLNALSPRPFTDNLPQSILAVGPEAGSDYFFSAGAGSAVSAAFDTPTIAGRKSRS